MNAVQYSLYNEQDNAMLVKNIGLLFDALISYYETSNITRQDKQVINETNNFTKVINLLSSIPTPADTDYTK